MVLLAALERAAVRQAATLLRIDPWLDKYPRELSGGQRQRVAIGRAIVRKPAVFLFDEPLSNLDAALRVQMRVELSRLHAELGSTMIYVTHDQVEAMTMGDRIAVFSGGEIAQVGTPLEIYFQPANEFVATFMGSPRINLFDAHVEDGTLVMASGARLALPEPLPPSVVGRVARLGVRAEHLQCVTHGGVAGTIELSEHLGGEVIAYVRVSGLADLVTVKLAADARVPARGERVELAPDFARVLYFDAAGRRIDVTG